MTISDDLLKILNAAGESDRKEGFTTGQVTTTFNGAQGTMTATVVIPVTSTNNADGIQFEAQDFLTPPAWYIP